jgi:hypothetical protein
LAKLLQLSKNREEAKVRQMLRMRKNPDIQNSATPRCEAQVSISLLYNMIREVNLLLFTKLGEKFLFIF